MWLSQGLKEFVTGSSVKTNFLLRVSHLSMHTLWRTMQARVAFVTSSLLLSHFFRSLHHPFNDQNNLQLPSLFYLINNWNISVNVLGQHCIGFHEPYFKWKCRVSKHKGWYNNSANVLLNIRNQPSWLENNCIVRISRKPTSYPHELIVSVNHPEVVRLRTSLLYV